jgi:GNAT superfamily N-acetyltransferase
MTFDVAEQPLSILAEYARVPIVFTVDRVLDVASDAHQPGGVVLTERPVDVPYAKDYDAIPGEGPLTWADRFDPSRSAIFTARVATRLVGGAAVALDSSMATLPTTDYRRPTSCAVLWDIRVSPEVRGRGIGSALFNAVETWARARHCRQLTVETQNINVAACRFYQRHGCVLRTINRAAYRDLPEEIQLFWHKELGAGGRDPMS